MPLTQIMHVDRLLQAENAAAEGSLLKSVTKVESIVYGYWVTMVLVI